jgi:putative ABC transport system permease protein
MRTCLKYLLRNLLRNKATSFITITGFAVSISMSLLLIAFIVNEFSYDKEYPNLNNIYRLVENDKNTSIAEEVPEYILDRYPQVEAACNYNNFWINLNVDDESFNGQMVTTDQSFFSIFSTKFILGNLQSALKNLNDVVLTESFAKKLFGEENPIGKVIVANHKESLTVTGVVKDFSDKSSIQADFITNSKLKIMYQGTSDGKGNQIYFFRQFLLLEEGIKDISRLEKMLAEDLGSIQFSISSYSIKNIGLIPFSKSYFKQGLQESQTKHANIFLIRILSIITVIILVLAIINYVNLSTAGHLKRYKEIGIRKTFGAGRKHVFMQFMTESFLVCIISFAIAILLTYLFAPLFESFLNSPINLNILIQPMGLLWLFVGVVFISFLSGFYPALSISRLKPSIVINKMDRQKGGLFGFRATLNTVQYVVSITLIIALIVLSKQINYVKTKDFGFNTDVLLRVDVHWKLIDKIKYMRDRFSSDSRINEVCFTHGSPGSIYRTSGWDELGENSSINILTSDLAFFNVFEIPLVKGREISLLDKNVCYINETAYNKTGWDTFEGKKFWGNRIIGVVKDFHFASMYNEISPLVILAMSDIGQMSVSHMTLKIPPENISGSMTALKDIWEEACPGYELNYRFYDDWLDSMYKKEENLTASIRLFAILAIFISCLGIFGLADFSTKKRTKEIAIRKINGAKVSEILTMLNKDFIKWVAIAFIIAVPIAYYAMSKWLENFAYKTTLSWWIFALAGLLALAIALLTVSWQSWRAATRNPVEALRYE